MEIVFASLLLAALGGFLTGALVRPKQRGWLLLLAFATPILVYTVWLAGAEPAEPGFWQWWATGLFYLAVPLLVGWAATAALYFAGTYFAPERIDRA